jgi:hypothetical protein
MERAASSSMAAPVLVTRSSAWTGPAGSQAECAGGVCGGVAAGRRQQQDPGLPN